MVLCVSALRGRRDYGRVKHTNRGLASISTASQNHTRSRVRRMDLFARVPAGFVRYFVELQFDKAGG